MSYKLQANMEVKEDEDLKEIKEQKMPIGSPLSGLVGSAAAGISRDLGKSMFGGPRAGGKTGMQMARQKRMMQAQARGRSLTQLGAAPKDDGLLRELARQRNSQRGQLISFPDEEALKRALGQVNNNKWESIDPDKPINNEKSTYLNQNAVDACKKAFELISDIETLYGQTDETRALRKQIETIFYGKQDHMDGEIDDVTVNGEPAEEEPPTNYDW